MLDGELDPCRLRRFQEPALKRLVQRSEGCERLIVELPGAQVLSRECAPIVGVVEDRVPSITQVRLVGLHARAVEEEFLSVEACGVLRITEEERILDENHPSGRGEERVRIEKLVREDEDGA